MATKNTKVDEAVVEDLDLDVEVTEPTAEEAKPKAKTRRTKAKANAKAATETTKANAKEPTLAERLTSFQETKAQNRKAFRASIRALCRSAGVQWTIEDKVYTIYDGDNKEVAYVEYDDTQRAKIVTLA